MELSSHWREFFINKIWHHLVTDSMAINEKDLEMWVFQRRSSLQFLPLFGRWILPRPRRGRSALLSAWPGLARRQLGGEGPYLAKVPRRDIDAVRRLVQGERGGLVEICLPCQR